MRAVDCTPEHAATVADILVAADLRGVHSHGVNRLEMYVGEVRNGEVDPRVRPQVTSETPAIACVDGRNGLGMVVGRYCMELAMEKAQTMGVGWVVARGSNHYGIAGYYAMMAAERGLVGMSYTNTSPISFPTRAAQHVLGTNPIAVAAPSTDPKGAWGTDTHIIARRTRTRTIHDFGQCLIVQIRSCWTWQPPRWRWARSRSETGRSVSARLAGEVTHLWWPSRVCALIL
jgi:hypothetical protein